MKRGPKVVSRDAAHKTVGFFNETFLTLQSCHNLTLVSRVKTSCDNLSNYILDTFLTTLRKFSSHVSISKQFPRVDLDAFSNTMKIMFQMMELHVLNGSAMLLSHESCYQLFQRSVTQLEEILRLMYAIQLIFKANNSISAAKFFSDMIFHLRQLKMAHSINLLKAKVMNLPNRAEELNEIIKMLDDLSTESGYLKSKIRQIEHKLAVSKTCNPIESTWKQNAYGFLFEYSQASFFDPINGSQIEKINPKSLLKTILNDTDENTTSQRLQLCLNMAQRLLGKKDHPKMLARVDPRFKGVSLNHRNELPLVWEYLKFYYAEIDGFLAKRQGTLLAENLAKSRSTAKKCIDLLLQNVTSQFMDGRCDFSESYANFQILMGIKQMAPAYQPERFDRNFFEKIEGLIEKEKHTRLDAIEQLLDAQKSSCFPDAALVTGSDESNQVQLRMICPSNIDMKALDALMRKALKEQRCKLKFSSTKTTLTTTSVLDVTMRDLEVFCHSLQTVTGSLMKENERIANEVSALSAEFQGLEVDSKKESVSGHRYMQENPMLTAKEKTKGLPNPAMLPAQPLVISPENAQSAKFAKMFGEEHKSNIQRCRMLSMVENYYVQLEDDPKVDNKCSKEETEALNKLFEAPHQAVNKGQQGFKLTNKTGELTICGKLMGSQFGRIRLYPYKKVTSDDHRNILWVFRRNVVYKDTKQELHHVTLAEKRGVEATKKSACSTKAKSKKATKKK